MLTNSTKNVVHSEIVGDFFMQLAGEGIPDGWRILSDESLWWVSSLRSCVSCFEFRYRTWRQAEVLAKTHRYVDAGVSDRESLPSEQVSISFDIAEHDHIVASAAYDIWVGIDRVNGQVVVRAPILPEDGCKQCLCKWDGLGNDLPTSIEDIENFINDWFGLSATCTVFEQPLLGDMSISYIALILSVMRRFGEYAPILCAGQADTKELAKRKAAMEYVERVAQTSQGREYVSLQNISQKNTCHVVSDQVWRSWWADELASELKDLPKSYGYAQNLIDGSTVAIPAHLLDRYAAGEDFFTGKLSPLAPTTSGFAAHVSTSDAREHAILELIERDACMRWWSNPEQAAVIAPHQEVQSYIAFVRQQLEHASGVAIEIRVLQLKSCAQVPTALVIATAKDEGEGPALLVGSASSFVWEDAVLHALGEIRMSIYNYQMFRQGAPDTQTVAVDDFSWVRAPGDHAQLYYAPDLRSRLSFLPILLAGEPKKNALVDTPADYNDLLDRLHDAGISVYGIEQTPRFCAQSPVEVFRVVMPSLRPLQFGFAPIHSSHCSVFSVAASLPHCFF